MLWPINLDISPSELEKKIVENGMEGQDSFAIGCILETALAKRAAAEHGLLRISTASPRTWGGPSRRVCWVVWVERHSDPQSLFSEATLTGQSPVGAETPQNSNQEGGHECSGAGET